MRKNLLALLTVGLMATTAMTACDDSGDSGDASSGGTATGSGQARVGIVLPDTKSSNRWRDADPKFLKQALDAAKVPVEIKNAEGDKEAFKRLGAEMLDSGATVLIIANLDSISGKAVIDDAKSHGVPVIDYDRLTLNGGADYYVSFDNEAVGRQQAQGLAKCLTDKKAQTPIVAELNGSPTDNNAHLFKAGYDEQLQAKYDTGVYMKGPDQWVPDWDAAEGTKIFQQMLDQQPKIRGVLAANDGLGGAAIEVLKKKGLNGKVPVTGQDATVEGLQNILKGDQCMTVYKPFRPEAQAAANLAIELFKKERPTLKNQIKDPESGAYVPFSSLTPRTITIDNINDVIVDKAVTKAELCTKEFAQLCEEAGIK